MINVILLKVIDMLFFGDGLSFLGSLSGFILGSIALNGCRLSTVSIVHNSMLCWH